MTEITSYKLNEIISSNCNELKNSNNFTDKSDKIKYILATHIGTMHGDQECTLIEAKTYITDVDLCNYKIGKSMMETLYNNGNTEAAMFMANEIKETDVNKAIEIYNKCLENSDCDKGLVYLKLGELYYDLGEKNAETAIQCWKISAEQFNNKEAQFVLSRAYYLGNGVEKDVSTSYSYCKIAADSGEPNAQYIIGDSYLGMGSFDIETDYKLAYKYLISSANNYNPSAMRDLGIIYYYGFDKPKDLEKATEWLKKANDFGESFLAYAFLGKIAYDSNDYEEAMKCLSISYEKNKSLAFLDILAYLYKEGLGCQEDRKKAVELYEIINEDQPLETTLISYIADSYYLGLGVDEDLSKAVKYYRICAEKDPYIMCRLGKIALYGKLPELNFQDAITFFTNAAERGVVEGYRILADYYYEKREPYYIDKAMEYYKKAFSAGDADAGYWIGVIYENGSAASIYKSVKEAVEWYKLAASKGSELGKHELNCFEKNFLGIYRRISR